MNEHIATQYKQAITKQASVVGLVIALHDALMGNLRRAAQAIESNDIPTRCSELIHGFKVLQQLEAMLDMQNGGPTAVSVHRFYTYIRSQMLKAQFELSAAMLRQQIQCVLEVRQAWHQLDSAPAEGSHQHKAFPNASNHLDDQQDLEGTRVSFTCSG